MTLAFPTHVLLILGSGLGLPHVYALRKTALGSNEEAQALISSDQEYSTGMDNGRHSLPRRHKRRKGTYHRSKRGKGSKSEPSDVEIHASQFNYTRVQFVSYDICTMPHGFSTRFDPDDDWYVGKSDIPEDITARIQLMENAVNVAYDRAEVEKSSDTLKVFMAPEFYFRGPNGAYKLTQVLGTKGSPGSFESRLANIVLDEKFRDWIFVFGTILGYRSKKNSNGKFEVYNIALVQQGGQGTLEHAITQNKAIVKQWKSGIDFLQDPQMGGLPLGMVEHAPWANPAVPTQNLNVSGDPDTLDTDNDGIFEMRGIKFGLEICLDHSMRRLRRESISQNGFSDLQVQLITSGGMSIVESAIAVQDGGLVFLTDGLMDFKGNSQCMTVRDDHNIKEAEPHEAIGSFPIWGKKWRNKLSDIFNTREIIPEGPHIRVYPVLTVPPRKSRLSS